MNQILTRVGACLFLGAFSVQAQTVFQLTTDESYSGTVEYNAGDWADWVLFYAAGTPGSVHRAGADLISDARIDHAFIDADMTAGPINTSWTGGTPVEVGVANYGARVALSGNQYWQVQGDGASTWLQFDVVSPRSDYTIDFYAHWWAMAVDLQVITDGGTTSLGTLDHGTDYRHLAIEVSGATVGTTNTVKFTNFSGNEAWGQFSVYSAAISVPEPSTWAMVGAGAFAVVALRCPRRRAG